MVKSNMKTPTPTRLNDGTLNEPVRSRSMPTRIGPVAAIRYPKVSVNAFQTSVSWTVSVLSKGNVIPKVNPPAWPKATRDTHR